MKFKHTTSAILVAFALLVGGCGLQNGDETQHPLFKKAANAKDNGDFNLAAECYNKLLQVRYDSPKTHLRLAGLYDEQLKQPLLAYYHYGQFLKYAPSSPEAANVKKWQKAALMKFYRQTRDKLNDPDDVKKLKTELDAALEKQKRYDKRSELLMRYVSQLKKHIKEITENSSRLQTEKDRIQADFEIQREKLKKQQQQIIDQNIELKAAKEELAASQKALSTKNTEEEIKHLIESRNTLKDQLLEKEKELQNLKLDFENLRRMFYERNEDSDTEYRPTKSIAEPLSMEKPMLDGSTQLETPEQPAEKKISEKEVKTQPPSSAKTSNSQKPKPPALTHAVKYTVKHGDTLTGISRRFYGTSRLYKLIFDANRNILQTEFSLRPGQVLTIPPLKK
ncbi:LysM peptidoglycan-binding domain-containing protein [Lentisphaerota bacterium ZTH]|nr:LysM peptidoglycan-binding domain-containing protein [Lentisphaerota bacterium]WET05950.1 LysM peptidoglycan-binding domain-containing protein [Lentisphaerota bacterium ZTH]